MADYLTLPVEKLQPWQAELLQAIDDYRLHRDGKPATIILNFDALGYAHLIEGRPRLAKIKLPPRATLD